MMQFFQKVSKIVLSKSIFYVKNQPNFFKKQFSSKNNNLGEHFLLKTFFSRLNFWTTLLSKIRPYFCRPHTMSIHKIQQFHLTTVDFWAKTMLFRTHQARNSKCLFSSSHMNLWAFLHNRPVKVAHVWVTCIYCVSFMQI